MRRKDAKKPLIYATLLLAGVRLKLPVRSSGCIHLTWCVDVQAAGRPTAGEGRPICVWKRGWKGEKTNGCDEREGGGGVAIA